MLVDVSDFQQRIYKYYHEYGRSFAWRDTREPYNIFISEVMLQQTQTDRVKEKYVQWLAKFPDFRALAAASVAEVIQQWQGLGYNRRALFVHKSAQIIVNDFDAILPNTPEALVVLPGIGKATAASICAFAFNMPTVFIETNIRAVYIHTFFPARTDVTDAELMPIIEKTVDYKNPRTWYYALMDYGVMLKKKYKNPSKKSAHYTIQSKFEGSDRQIRGAILRALSKNSVLTKDDILFFTQTDPVRTEQILLDLCSEGFISLQNSDFYSLCR